MVVWNWAVIEGVEKRREFWREVTEILRLLFFAALRCLTVISIITAPRVGSCGDPAYHCMV
jgi:hypothetical protein